MENYIARYSWLHNEFGSNSSGTEEVSLEADSDQVAIESAQKILARKNEIGGTHSAFNPVGTTSYELKKVFKIIFSS